MVKSYFSLILFFASLVSLHAQVHLTGRVTDAANGEPLVGVTIAAQAAKERGTITDLDGNFTLSTKAELPLTLSVQFVGYKSQEVDVYDDSESIDIKLTEELSSLDEVVVVGYGTQKRTQLTGSVTKIKASTIEQSISPTLDNALSGQVAGLNVTASSGQPGGDSQIRIRGGNSVTASNEPLYVIDGFIYFKDESDNSTGLGSIEGTLNPLGIINPNDIESVEVLKDISATAIYGSRGANGVILVTTKKGEKGKGSISYGYTIGVSQVSKKLDLLNATEWVQFQKTYFRNKAGYTDEEIAALGKGTDWQDAVLRNALQQTHELSVTGGKDKARYAFSASYTDQEGIVLNSGFERYNFHTNVEWEPRKHVNFGLNATFGRLKQEGLTTTEKQNFNSSPFSAGITNSFVYALLMPPVVDVYKADGSYNFNNPYEYAYFAIGDHAANPVYDLNESVAENINNYLLANIWATYKWGKVTLKATLGLNSEKLTQNFFAGAYTSLGLAVEGIGGKGDRQTDVWQEEYTAHWSEEYQEGRHAVELLAGYTRQTTTSNYSTISVNHFTNESLKQYNLGDGSNVYTPKTGLRETELHSILARANYSLLNRYNVTATYRSDYSSRFATGQRWGSFPSIGISWNVDKEPFFSNVRHIDYLKTRASWGQVGNQEIPAYAFETSYNTTSYGGSSSYSKQNTANPDLKWETTASYNFGFDLGMLRERINIVADIYYKKTKDLLFYVPMGFASGVTYQLQNVGNVVNKGAELQVSGTILKRRGLQWSASANVAHNKNEITDMGKSKDIIQGTDNQQILRKGEAFGAFYGLRFDGIVQNEENVSALPTVNGQTPKPGDVKYVDTDHNDRIDANDRQILGSTQPDLTYGFSTQITYRRFDFSASFAGSHGNKVYNALGRRLEETTDSYNVLGTIRNSWTAEKGGNTLPLASNVRPFDLIDDRYVQDAGYLKLRELSIGYRLPLPKELQTKARIYISGSNLLTWTRYKGYDPEVAKGTDSGAYPSARTVVLGVRLNL